MSPTSPGIWSKLSRRWELNTYLAEGSARRSQQTITMRLGLPTDPTHHQVVISGQLSPSTECPKHAAEGVSSNLERQQSDSPLPSKRPSSRSETSESPLSLKRPRTAEKGTAEQMYQCPYCKFTNTDLNRLRMHVMTQHSVQPMLRCPLCQDMLNNKIHLQFHLTHLHSVAPDCVDKLIATVTATEVLPASMFIPVPSPDKESQSTPLATANSNSEDTKKQTDATDADPEKGVSLTTDIAESRKSPSEDQQSEKEDATGFLCWKKGCSQVFKSSNSLQMHFNEVHNKRPQLPVSDRHVYKYRCNQCSLAFKTVEKLQLHSQYHVIRAATMCCLCQRSFRTLQALKKHLETSHLELSEADIQQLYGGLLMNGDIMAMGDLALNEEHGSLEEDDKEGDDSDPEEKQSPTGSDSGSLQEDSGSEPKRALPFRKGPNFTMEKFLDPSRPFKCTVCKESFTQKNILVVHYNSVSHLHKPMSLQSLPTQLPPQLPSVEPSLASDLAQLYQQQLTPAMLQQQNKRPRTRITDDQLRVLRQYFDINNSPNEEQIKEMADKSGLPQKVIKHWFRNTLFKERQRNKDSPYNFNNPPTTTLEETKIDSKPPSPEPQKHEFYGSKRSSRTRFTDYQLRVLQDFFDANAYPKDDEFEQLSNLLSLPTRVIVVWFQNARQKARKNYENQGDGGKMEKGENYQTTDISVHQI
ncbi:hypothetical protein CRENBAI_007783 [Crenichthys baileyi]|uniref:Zinc finger homeobox 3 n=1 Tax=Crenichthys baileyi TaxID=28760 RepID=A0AAV9S656_9TELE